MAETEFAVIKECEHEQPIPSSWRPTFVRIVAALANADYKSLNQIEGVLEVSNETASQIEAYIADYGYTLIELPPKTWETSVCIFMGSYWSVLIDLWTKEEGASDLVLSARVFEVDDGYSIRIDLVYVP